MNSAAVKDLDEAISLMTKTRRVDNHQQHGKRQARLLISRLAHIITIFKHNSRKLIAAGFSFNGHFDRIFSATTASAPVRCGWDRNVAPIPPAIQNAGRTDSSTSSRVVPNGGPSCVGNQIIHRQILAARLEPAQTSPAHIHPVRLDQSRKKACARKSSRTTTAVRPAKNPRAGIPRAIPPLASAPGPGGSRSVPDHIHEPRKPALAHSQTSWPVPQPGTQMVSPVRSGAQRENPPDPATARPFPTACPRIDNALPNRSAHEFAIYELRAQTIARQSQIAYRKSIRNPSIHQFDHPLRVSRRPWRRAWR